MIALLSLFLACSGDEPAPTPPAAPEAAAPAPAPVDSKVLRAVELARAVQADPANAEAALTAKGSSKAELDSLMYEIAQDARLTDAYARELGR